MVEAGVYDDGETCREKDSGREDEKRKGSILFSTISNFRGLSNGTCGRNEAIGGG